METKSCRRLRARDRLIRQVEKLASVCQADPGVAHSDVIVALVLLVRLLCEHRALRRRPPCGLGFDPPGDRLLPDDEGVELPSRGAARLEAQAVVRELSSSVANRWA